MGTKNNPIIRPCPICGTEYEYRRASGRTFPMCEHCRQPDCVICGKKVPIDRGRKNTCCVECEKLKIHNIQNLHYAKKISSDPDFNKQRHLARKLERESNPELMELHRQKERERHYRRINDDDYRTSRKLYQAKRWESKKDEIQAQRVAFWNNLTEEEKLEKIERNRDIQKKSSRKKRERLMLNPEKWEEYQNYQRQKLREHRHRKALNELMVQTRRIKDVADNNEK